MEKEAAYWLAFLQAGGLPLKTLKPVAQRWVLMEGKSIVDLFNLSAAELSVHFDVGLSVAEGILRAADTFSQQLQRIEAWQKEGITVVPLSHPQYPVRLGYTLPPIQQPLVLWAKGNLSLLTEPTVTILGKTDPTPGAEDFVKALTPILVDENIGLASSYDKGLDRYAFETMLQTATGFGIAVLPMGIAAFCRTTHRLDGSLSDGRAALLSPFAPESPFSRAAADARNILVDSLAMVLLLPEETRAALPRAQAAISRGMPVLVDKTDTPENRELITAGAFLLTDYNEVIDMVQQAIIDGAMQWQVAQKPAAPTPEAPAPHLSDEADNYALGQEIVEPLPATDALDILDAGGAVPNSLRARLMALEEESKRAQNNPERK